MKKTYLENLQEIYDETFIPDDNYLSSLPDIQNTLKSIPKPIDFVGVHNFHVPIRIREKSGDTQEVMANITGTVSLEADKKGINMSRIIRSFYKSKDDVFDIDKLEQVLRDYQKDLDSFDAHILMNFKYRVWQNALRSKKEDGTSEGGWQFYNITFDCSLDVKKRFTKIIHVDYVYSSACPCSKELSRHAAIYRNIYCIPHSQRSLARISAIFSNMIWIEDILDICNKALHTETLVFCKRQDEQAFAEMNGAYPKFVEDAIRYIAKGLDENKDIYDYKIVCSHKESLHSHDAVAVMTKGIEKSIFSHYMTLGEWQSMIC